MNNLQIRSTGNSNQWNALASNVLRQYNITSTEKELKECIRFDYV